jgi:MFS family permease
VVALVSRFTARRLPERLGLPRMILIGLAALMLAQFLFLPVRSEWHLIFPGLVSGLGQAILYPTIVTASTSPYPVQYRGVATTLILAAFDLGQVFGAPAAGLVLHYAETFGLPAYPAMYVAMAAALLVAGGLYGGSLRNAGREAVREGELAEAWDARRPPARGRTASSSSEPHAGRPADQAVSP